MSTPNTAGKLCRTLEEMEIGDYIPARWKDNVICDIGKGDLTAAEELPYMDYMVKRDIFSIL